MVSSFMSFVDSRIGLPPFSLSASCSRLVLLVPPPLLTSQMSLHRLPIVETTLAMSPGRRRLRYIFRHPAFRELSDVSLLSASRDNYDFDAAARTNEERVCEKGG